MAELVASIIGISGAALKLSNGLYKVAIALKNAGQDVRDIANDTAQFSRALKELSHSLGSDAPSMARARNVAEDVIATCLFIQNDGEKLLIILKPLIEQSEGSMPFSNIILKIRWLFERSKFAYHRELLSTLKSTLQLLVSVIILEKVPDRDMISQLVDEVVNLRHTVQGGMCHMENHLQSSQLLEAFQPRSSLPALTGAVSILAIEGPDRAEIETATSHTSNSDPDDGASSSNNMAVQGQAEPSESAQSTSEEGFPPAVGPVGPLALLPYFRAYLAQERVCQYANDTLKSVQYDQDGNPLDVQRDLPTILNTQLSASSASGDPAQKIGRGDTNIVNGGSDTHNTEMVVESPLPAPSAPPDYRSQTPNDPGLFQPASQTAEITRSQMSSIGSGSAVERASTSNSTPPASHTGTDSIKNSAHYIAELPSSQSSTRANATDSQPEKTKEAGTQPEPDPDVVFFVTHEGEQIPMPFSKCRTYDGLVESVRQYGFGDLIKSPYWRSQTHDAIYRMRNKQMEYQKSAALRRFWFLTFETEVGKGSRTKVEVDSWEEEARPGTLILIEFDRRDLADRFNSRLKEYVEIAKAMESARLEEETARKASEQAQRLAEIEESRLSPGERRRRRFKGLFSTDRS